MMRRALTITIPFHRGLAYLREAVESVLEQRHPEWQLIVCDDGVVEPGARELVEDYADARIRYVANAAALGMVGNWNRCLELAEGELVTLLHADDRLLPHYAELMLDLGERYPEAVALYCAASIIDERGRARFSTADWAKRFYEPRSSGELVLRGEEALAALMAGNFIMCPTLCFNRTRLGARHFSTAWQQVQDLELTARLLMDGDALVGSTVVAYEYRRHAAAATATQSRSFLRFDEEFALFDQVADRAAELGWGRAARVSRRKRVVKLHLLYRALGEFARLRPGRALEHLRHLARGAGKRSAAERR